VPAIVMAQEPAGTIAGVVRDPAGNVIPQAALEAVRRATAQERRAVTGEHGDYSFPALFPGEYEVSVEAPGFRKSVRLAIVETGMTTRADFVLSLPSVIDSVTVAAASPLMHYDSASVSGVISREHIDALPLNGRTFLELAKLEPGVQQPSAANRNRTVVPLLGSPAVNTGGARFTIDGGSITSVGLGGAQMGLSQESVQEFQVTTVNFGLAAGMTDAGSINVVTRGGSNHLQGTAFCFFRDHSLSAYPFLIRDSRNPDPFFQRQQFGAAIGGPLRRNRVFYFANWERNVQRSISATTLLAPEFAPLSRVTSNPLRGDLFSVRLDAKINNAHTAFGRHSYDGSQAFGPGAAVAGGSPNAYPSNWSHVDTSGWQSLFGLTSVLRPTLLNDLRLSSFVLNTQSGPPREEDCRGCLGLGRPQIAVALTGLIFGSSSAIDTRERRFHLSDSMTWQARAHRVRVGIDWEHNRDRNLTWTSDPVSMTLYSPARVRAFNVRPGTLPDERIPLPTTFATIDDILRLPLQSMTVGIGEAGVRQEDGGFTRQWNTVWVYADDVWRARDRLTLTYGLGWGADGPLNHDLQKPLLLAPLLGGDGLDPTRRRWTNFSPAASVIWTASSDGKTIVRAAAGRFYRPFGLTSIMDAERVALGPPGLGRQLISGSAILNPLSGIPGVTTDTPLDFRLAPSHFNGANLLAALPAIRAGQSALLAAPQRNVQQIQITKQQAAAGTAIFPADVPNPSAVHVHAGLQRQLGRGMVVSADVVYRHFAHVPQNGGAIDVNHYDSVRGPVIRACTPPEFVDAAALCSRGAINVYVAPYRFTYKGLLIRAEKRFSDGWQFLGSYAYSRNSGINAGSGFNLENWSQNYGPAANDLTHIVNLAAVVRLPWAMDLGANFSYSSVPPFSAIVGGSDFDGDGTTNDLLPGTTVHAFNRGMGRLDLERLVTAFNTTDAGIITPLTLPTAYSLGDNFHTLDVRVSRPFIVGARFRVSLIGEAFNLYNAANLTDYSGDLTTATFGQPGSRVRHLFGSGGPRSFQLAARVSF
jgi:hypothetical protein